MISYRPPVPEERRDARVNGMAKIQGEGEVGEGGIVGAMDPRKGVG